MTDEEDQDVFLKIKADNIDIEVVVWTGLVWFRIGTSGELL
jgi:hypothetical protein